MIRTASKTTASLSEAKNSKTGLICQAGWSDEFEFAMRRSISSARTRVRSNRRWIGRSAGDAKINATSPSRLASNKPPLPRYGAPWGLFDPPNLRNRVVVRPNARRSTRPRFPAFANWPCVIVDVDLFQSFNAVFHRFGRGFVLLPG